MSKFRVNLWGLVFFFSSDAMSVSSVTSRWQLLNLIPVRVVRSPAPGVTKTCHMLTEVYSHRLLSVSRQLLLRPVIAVETDRHFDGAATMICHCVTGCYYGGWRFPRELSSFRD